MVYQGNFVFSRSEIIRCAPSRTGIYYCGRLDLNNNLSPLYIGRATGIVTSIRSRLLDHLGEGKLSGVTYFGFRQSDNITDIELFESQEIANFKPLHNTHHNPLSDLFAPFRQSNGKN